MPLSLEQPDRSRLVLLRMQAGDASEQRGAGGQAKFFPVRQLCRDARLAAEAVIDAHGLALVPPRIASDLELGLAGVHDDLRVAGKEAAETSSSSTAKDSCLDDVVRVAITFDTPAALATGAARMLL
ncbi:MAG: hypothetical protein WDN31_19030 [Hyphomicrobium sp.]